MSRRALEKAETHARIVASAGKLMRREGLAAASVIRVMRGAGLTIGGFYAHFRSKGAMDAEVLQATLSDVRGSWLAGLDDSRGVDWLARAVKRYLAVAHRDGAGAGCPLPAVLSEVPRADKKTRLAMAEALDIAAKEIASHAPEAAGISARERALATLVLCVGGLAVSRALRGHPLSDEVLRACVKWALPETAGNAAKRDFGREL